MLTPLIRFLFRLLPFILLLLVGWYVWRQVKETFGPDDKQPEVIVNHNTILTTVEELGRMELVRYNFKDVVEYEKEVSRWIPNSKVMLVVTGEAVGCVDFTKLTEQDIRFQGDS